MSTTVDLRCDRDPRRLFAKLRVSGERPTITDGNLFEVTCRDCVKALRDIHPSLKQVFHRFDAAGDLVETEAVDEFGERLFLQTAE